MPEEEPVCDCEEGEPPDPDPACSGEEDTCPPGYVSCGATGGTFILDSDVEWTWVNNDGCPEGCVAFKSEQPTAEEEAAGVAPGDFSYDGICCELEDIGCCIMTVCNCNYASSPPTCTLDGPNNVFTPSTEANCDELPFPENFVCDDSNESMFSITFTEAACREGCCETYTCTNSNGTYAYTLVSSNPSSANCAYPLPPDPTPPPCDGSPESTNYTYTTWSEGSCTEEGCCTHWNCTGDPLQYTAVETFTAAESDCIMPITEFSGDPSVPCNNTPRNLNMNYNTWVAGPCAGGLSVPSDGPVEVMERPCSQEECDAHVSTWMAEPSGEPNEEGLYKVKWILLDGCPGACCSDQPTQPEFVKKSELIDAPCKCGCD